MAQSGEDSKRGATVVGGCKLKEREIRKEAHSLANHSGIFLIRRPRIETLSPNVEVAASFYASLSVRKNMHIYAIRPTLTERRDVDIPVTKEPDDLPSPSTYGAHQIIEERREHQESTRSSRNRREVMIDI